MNKLNPCPYLRVKGDPETYAAYPSRSNQCHHARPNQNIAPLYQQHICLTTAHQGCPIFKHEGLWPGKLPAEIRTDAAYEAAIKKQGKQVITPATEAPSHPQLDPITQAHIEPVIEPPPALEVPAEPEPEPDPIMEAPYEPMIDAPTEPAIEETFEPEPEPDPIMAAPIEPVIEVPFEPEPEPIFEAFTEPEPIMEAPYEPMIDAPTEPAIEETFEPEPEPSREAFTEPEPIMEAPYEPMIDAPTEPAIEETFEPESEPSLEAFTEPEPIMEAPYEPIIDAPFEPEPEPEPIMAAPIEPEPEPIEPEIEDDAPPAITPVPTVLERISPAKQLERDTLPEVSGGFDPVGESGIERISPSTIAAEVRSGERPKPPSGRPDKVVVTKAEKNRQREEARARIVEQKQGSATAQSVEQPATKRAAPSKRPLLIIGGLVAAMAVCALLGLAGAAVMRGMLNAPPAPTATVTVQATEAATLDDSGTATANAVSITPTVEALPTTAVAPTTQPIAVQDTRMRFDGNLRAGPGTEYDLISEVIAGTPISVIGRDELGVWLTVRLGSGQEGWIPASQVDTDTINVLSAPLVEATYAPLP